MRVHARWDALAHALGVFAERCGMQFEICKECGHWLARTVPDCKCTANCHPHLKEPDYKLRCMDCRYSKFFGPARITAQSKAVTHSLKYHHRVKLTNHGKPYAEVRPRTEQGTLTEVPF